MLLPPSLAQGVMEVGRPQIRRKKGRETTPQMYANIWGQCFNVKRGRPLWATSQQARTQPLSLLASNVIFQLQIGIHAALIYGVSLPPAYLGAIRFDAMA